MHRRARLWSACAVTAAAVALSCIVPGLHAAPAHASDDAIELSTDATGPLFNATNLGPGSAASECVAISYDAPAPTSLRMAAATDGGGLADYLDLNIELGTGGGYGNCGAFVGAEIFAGTLAEFAATYASPAAGLRLGAERPSGGTVSLRVTVALRDDSAAMGQRVGSSFTWYAVAPGGEPEAPHPDPDPAPPADPQPGDPPSVSVPVTGPRPTPTPIPSGSNRPATGGPATPSATGTPVATAEPPSGDGGANDGRSLLGRLLDAVVDGVERVAPAVIKGARIPLGLLLVMFIFLLIQNEIDRRDPKLALAPAYADPDLPFDYPAPDPARA